MAREDEQPGATCLPLSPQQAEVVSSPTNSRHLLILARPGSGKTYTLAARARRLLEIGIAPDQILAMTFSRRAALELRDRLPGGQIWAGTFHAICAGILEMHGSAIGVRWPFRIVDEARSRELVSRAVSDVGLALPADDRVRGRFLRKLQACIERRKRLGQSEHEDGAGGSIGMRELREVDARYGELLHESHALDFADLVARALELLENDEVTAQILRARVTHLLIDEAHDIPPDQYRLITLLAPPLAGNQVLIVGDPDQAIYSWRGADATRILHQFRADYRPREYHLTINFRSRAPIVSAADALMRGTGRTDPSRTHRPGVNPPVWCEVLDASAEGKLVVSEIERAIAQRRVEGFGAFAVLYRTHALGDAVEAELLRAAIPLWRIQPYRFFEDADAQESLRYLELAAGLYGEAFEPALNWPRMIVDEITLVSLQRLARSRGVSLIDLLRQIDQLDRVVTPLTRGAIRDFLDTMGRDLEPLVSRSMVEALEPFLDALKARRGLVASAERPLLRDTLDLAERTLAAECAFLTQALRDDRPIVLQMRNDPDCVAAAVMLRYVLRRYFDHDERTTDVDSGAAPFTVTFGDHGKAGPDGIALGPLSMRTVDLTVATRTWRLLQMALMEWETLDREAFLLIDVETTGVDLQRAELLEAAAVPYVDGEIDEANAWTSLVRPSSSRSITREATDIHGIRWQDVRDAPTVEECLPEFLDVIGSAVVAGHNILDFDMPVLQRVARRSGLELRLQGAVDTRTMAERIWPGEASYRLEDLVRRFDPTVDQRHRAREDCLLTGRLLKELLLASRRDREIDVLPECLPLVAASIATAGVDIVNDNELLVDIARRCPLQHLAGDLMAEWSTLVDQRTVERTRHMLQVPARSDPEETSRWDRLERGWRSAVDAFAAGEPDPSVYRFLQHAALAQPIDTAGATLAANNGGNSRALGKLERVTLSSIHGAKGLEWHVVFVVGLEDDQLPPSWVEDEAALDEERRVLYVAMTRARDRLYLVSAESRADRPARRSRFLTELVGGTVQATRKATL